MKEKLKLEEAKSKLKGEGEDKPKRTNQMVRRYISYYIFFVFVLLIYIPTCIFFREVVVVEPSFISSGVECNGCRLNLYQRMRIVVKRMKKKTIVRVSVKY